VLGLGRAFRGGLMWVGGSRRRRKGWVLMSTTTVIRIDGYGDVAFFFWVWALILFVRVCDDQGIS
jgi:hypothetical protein